MVALRALIAVLAVVFGGSAAVFAMLGRRRWSEQGKLRGWRRVDGVITRVEIEPGPNATARPRLHYRFELDGQPHEGEGLEEALSAFLPEVRARGLERRFVAGTSVQVRVEPSDPSHAVLESGMAPRAGLLLLAGVVFLTLSLAFAAAAALLG